MNFEERMKTRIDSKLNEIVPNPTKKKRLFPLWAKIVLPLAAASIATAVILPAIAFYNNLENAISRLSGTRVDMEDVKAFAVWNAPTKKAKKGNFSHIAYLNQYEEESEALNLNQESEFSSELTSLTPEQEWELDYDWDPTKANVLVSLDGEGEIKEVVYERTNNNGVVRQDTLGNAAAVYVSQGFTYVMYANDSEWEFWKDINFAQESVTFNGFHCHHEMLQTIVIHNETGNVFALKDLIKQVSDISGALNYTMQVHTTYDDYIRVDPMYGKSTTQWYRVKYDEATGLRYEYVELNDGKYIHDLPITSIQKDKYGQEYVYTSSSAARFLYDEIGNTFVSGIENTLLHGSDGRMYSIYNNTLRVFGENFELLPIEDDLKVSMEGLASSIILTDYGVSYHVEENYLYSMFGEVWKITPNSELLPQKSIEGSFPYNALDGYLIGGEIIVMNDADEHWPDNSIHGRLERLSFGLENGVPSVKRDVILDYAARFHVQNHRMTVQDGDHVNEEGSTFNFYRVVVKNGDVSLDKIAYGTVDHGCFGVAGLAKPITEPLDLNY